MRFLPLILLFSLFFPSLFAARREDPSMRTGQYYYARGEYKAALESFADTLRRHPTDTAAVVRLAQLKLLNEGRAASQEVLKSFLTTQEAKLLPAQKARVRTAFTELQNLFVTEQGQSLFLQARVRVQNREWATALPLLDQANRAEDGGNLRILRERWLCLMQLEDWEGYYNSLKHAYVLNSFDSEIAQRLAEAHFRVGAFTAITQMHQNDSEPFRKESGRLVLALTYLELQRDKEALAIFQSLHDEASAYPVIYYGLGKILTKRSPSISSGISYLEKFVGTNRCVPASLAKWDFLKCGDRIELAKKQIAEFRDES